MSYEELQSKVRTEAVEKLTALRRLLNDVELQIQSKDLQEFNTGLVVIETLTMFFFSEGGLDLWITKVLQRIQKRQDALFNEYKTEH